MKTSSVRCGDSEYKITKVKGQPYQVQEYRTVRRWNRSGTTQVAINPIEVQNLREFMIKRHGEGAEFLVLEAVENGKTIAQNLTQVVK